MMQDMPRETNAPVPPNDMIDFMPQSSAIQEPMDRYPETSSNGNQNNDKISPAASSVPELASGIEPAASWDMIGLGLEEPLPTQQAIDEL